MAEAWQNFTPNVITAMKLLTLPALAALAMSTWSMNAVAQIIDPLTALGEAPLDLSFLNQTGIITRTQQSVTVTDLGNGLKLWETVNRWTNTGSVDIRSAYFAYVGQQVSVSGSPLMALAWDSLSSQWRSGDITATPTGHAGFFELSAIAPAPTLPSGSQLSLTDRVAFYWIGDIPSGQFVDASITRTISAQVTAIGNTALVPVSAVPEPAAGLLGLLCWPLLRLRRS
jgi:hypothetical protein